ncbi:MAG: hypothetical protein J6W59_05375, partial [Bacteroidales bacterium]|nr:hypothetical protein [Bacteroidales bacterium]
GGVDYEILDENGEPIRDGNLTTAQFSDAMLAAAEPVPAAVGEQVFEEAPAPAQPAFPVDEQTGYKAYDHPSVTPEMALAELYNGIAPGSKDAANRKKYIDGKAEKAAADVTEAENKIAGLQAKKALVDEWDINDGEEIDAFEQRKAAERQRLDEEIAQIEAELPELQRRASHWAAVRDLANPPAAPADEKKKLQRRISNRAKKWEKMTGVKVNVLKTLEKVEKASVGAAREIKNGERVFGWFNLQTGQVYVYLPNIEEVAELDRTIIHEVVSHKGLRELLTTEGYNELCDRVWNELMTPEDRKKWMDYNSHLTGTEEFLHRAAADEFIADISEHLNEEGNQTLFDKLVEWVKEILDRLMASTDIEAEAREKVEAAEAISTDMLRELLADSMARYVARTRASMSPNEVELDNNGMASNQEEVRFSVKYVPDEGEIENVVSDITKQVGVSEEEARQWVESEVSLASLITGEPTFLDYTGDDRYTAIKTDADYPQGTVDFNNICRKRLAFTEMYQRIQKAFPNVIITGEDLATIRNIMKAHGITVACGLCYVEDRRQLLGEIAKDFIDNVNTGFADYESRGGETKKKNAEKFRSLIGDDKKADLSIYDLVTLDGSTRLHREHPGIYEAFQAFNSARGQQAGNLFQGYAEYKREILKWSPAKVKKVNDNGGLRIFSYSDFEAHHLIDLVQIIQDCARMGVKIQGYTKVPAFARAVAETGLKLNRSLIPLGDTGIVDGKLAYDP